MSDNLEALLRKSLDATERKRKGVLAIGIAMVLVACAQIIFNVRAEIPALMLWTGGLALLIISIVLRSTRFILKAIDTMANQKPE